MKADTITKDFISDAEVFADIFNYYIYEGQQVIFPEQLMERDSVTLAFPYGADGIRVPIQKLRDGQKLCIVKTDGKTEYVLFGAENQTEIHYAMAVKNNLYDALEYAGQVEKAAKAHKKARKDMSEAGKKPNSGEFLSGFWKEDRLIPSVTLTVYFGCEEWDGPLSLFDMMDVADPRILSCMDDYHVRLIAPNLMTDKEILKFQSNLREVMLFIKYSKDKDRLQEVLENHEERFREMERRAVDVIEVITNTGLKYEEKGGKVDVCQAIQEMRTESERIGEQRGEQRGERIGEQRGERIGEKKGELKKAKESARNFYDLGIEIETIAEGIGYTVETVKGWLGLSEQP